MRLVLKLCWIGLILIFAVVGCGADDEGVNEGLDIPTEEKSEQSD